jgi:CRP/FNR family transcriptional regulator
MSQFVNNPPHPLSAIELFADLQPGVLDDMLAASRVRRFPKGQILCSEGDPGDDLILLEVGRVRVSRYGAGGREVALAEVDAPRAFGEISLFDQSPRAASLIALTNVQVRLVPGQMVIRLAEQTPKVAMALLQSMATMVRATNDRLSDMLALDVSARLAKWLLVRSCGNDVVVITESQESLGLTLGTTRVTINRILHQFERAGMIRINGPSIEVADRAALTSVSEG